MGQPEGMHLISERTERHISSHVLKSLGMQKKAVPEQAELSGKIRCFACYETSHSLDQCSIKYRLVTVAHQFGYATKFPFIMIQPSEQMLEKEKFYHHCVLITSSVSNLDLDIVKGELQKLWNLSCGWVLKRECSKSFLASFNSQDDVVRCLKEPNIETSLDEEEVKLAVTRWTECDDENSDLIKQWFLVFGVPRKYRAWSELYQVASAFGLLIDVDEGSLEVGDKQPIRLKIALINHDGSSFSYHYMFGLSSRIVEAKVDSDNSSCTRTVTSTGNHVLELDFRDSTDSKEHEKELNVAQSMSLEEPTCIEESIDRKTKENQISSPAVTVNDSKKTTAESSKPEGVQVQSIRQNSTRMIGEDHFTGIQKPPIKHVFKRREMKQQVSDEAINKSPLNKMDKGMGPESNNATRIGDSEMDCKMEMNMEEIALMEVSKKSEEVVAFREEENSVTLAATTINSKGKKISEDSSKIERVQLVTAAHTKVIVPRDEELEDIRQFYIKVEKEEMKLSKLYTVLKTRKVTKLIVFVNTKDKVMSLAEEFGKHYIVSASHEDMDQHARGTAIQKFLSEPSSILITTDLQGTNTVVQVPTVINYDLPTQPMHYIRRVQQQNGQPGRKSLVINLVTRTDERVLFEIQRLCNGQLGNLSDI